MGGGAWWAAVHGVAESDMTERLHFHFSLSCTGEGNGNPLQCSCLENPRDGGAQSWTRLKRLSSSSSSKYFTQASLVVQTVKNLPAMQESWIWSMGWEDPLEKDGKASVCNAGDTGLILGLGRSPGEGNGNPLQYSYLENPMDRGAW